MPAGRTGRAAGFTLGELLVVTLLAVVTAAVAVPVVWRASRMSQLETARAEVARSLRLASELAATTGDAVPFTAAGVAIPSEVVVMPHGLDPPVRATPAETFFFQGGTGHPLVNGERAAAAILLAERGREAQTAVAVVVGPSGTLVQYRLIGGRWEELQ